MHRTDKKAQISPIFFDFSLFFWQDVELQLGTSLARVLILKAGSTQQKFKKFSIFCISVLKISHKRQNFAICWKV